MKTMREIDLFATAVNRKRGVWFRGRDNYSLSDKRYCLLLQAGETANFTFELAEGEVREGSYEVVMAGMLQVFDSHAYTRKHLNSLATIEVNGVVVHDGIIHWRSHEETASFWPIFDFRFDGSILKPGRNRLRFSNRTSRKGLGEFFDPQLGKELGERVAEEKLSNLYLSDLAVGFAATRRIYPALAGVPRAAVVGRSFIFEVSSGNSEGAVEVTAQENAAIVELGCELELGEYRHLFEVTALRAGERCRVVAKSGARQWPNTGMWGRGQNMLMTKRGSAMHCWR